MSGTYRDAGVVLRTYKLGETDRIVVLMTEQHGKVRAVAKGVRKPKSKFAGRLEPLSHVSLQLFEGRNLHTITQAESIDHWRATREDLERLTAGIALVEAVDHLAQENQPNERLYQMLVGALRTIEARPAAALVPAFLLKLLAAEGVRPELDACVSCGDDGPFVAFDPDAGGVLCRTCRRGIAVSTPAIDMMRRILSGSLLAVLDEPISPVTHEVDVTATRFFEHHVERRLRAVHALG
jgi:DNA repair protein RecO (recombination protein O)